MNPESKTQEGIIPCRIENCPPVIRVLLCDDDRLFLSKLRALIQSFFVEWGVKVHSAAPNGSWCGDQRQLSAANGTLN